MTRFFLYQPQLEYHRPGNPSNTEGVEAALAGLKDRVRISYEKALASQEDLPIKDKTIDRPINPGVIKTYDRPHMYGWAHEGASFNETRLVTFGDGVPTPRWRHDEHTGVPVPNSTELFAEVHVIHTANGRFGPEPNHFDSREDHVIRLTPFCGHNALKGAMAFSVYSNITEELFDPAGQLIDQASLVPEGGYRLVKTPVDLNNILGVMGDIATGVTPYTAAHQLLRAI